MPEMRSYLVTQVREVKVKANSLKDAVGLATEAFEHGQMKSEPSIAAGHGIEGVWGNTTSFIREKEIYAKEDR